MLRFFVPPIKAGVTHVFIPNGKAGDYHSYTTLPATFALDRFPYVYVSVQRLLEKGRSRLWLVGLWRRYVQVRPIPSLEGERSCSIITAAITFVTVGDAIVMSSSTNMEMY